MNRESRRGTGVGGGVEGKEVGDVMGECKRVEVKAGEREGLTGMEAI